MDAATIRLLRGWDTTLADMELRLDHLVAARFDNPDSDWRDNMELLNALDALTQAHRSMHDTVCGR